MERQSDADAAGADGLTLNLESVSGTKFQGWTRHFNSFLERQERSSSPFLPLIAAIFFYIFLAFARSLRPLWHDELYTYYIALSPTFAHFIAALTKVDLNPPLPYVLTRLSLKLLGDTTIACRAPFTLGFLIGSICLYQFIRRRLGRFYGLTAMLILWCSPFLQYATEARPYALILAFFGITILGWQAATDNRKRGLGLFVMSFGVWGMLMSHCFGLVVLTVIAAAELIRSVERRKIDWPIWVSLAIPTPFLIIYVPLFQKLEGWTVLPPEFQASPLKIVDFYSDLLSSSGGFLLIALVLALFVGRATSRFMKSYVPRILKRDITLVIGLFMLPVFVNLVLMRSGGAFFPRYCIATGFGLGMLFVFVLAKLTNGSQTAAATAAGCVFLGLVSSTASEILHPPQRAIVKTISLKELNHQLPLVTASGLTFLEMDKREGALVVSRLFYLTDREAAIHYAHATIFEGLPALRDVFPIRGNVEDYQKFIHRSRHFLVLGTPDYPEDWLIAKLIADKAQLNFLGELRRGYKDQMLFEVRMPGAGDNPK